MPALWTTVLRFAATVSPASPKATAGPEVSRRTWWTAAAGVALALLVPIAIVDVPPMTDYPGHLALATILFNDAHDAVLQRMFDVRWGIFPNLAFDVLVPALMRIVSPSLAGRCFVALAVLLPFSGAIALNRATFKRRTLWSLGAGLVSYNAVLLVGLMTFHVAAGVAFWGAAAWIVMAGRRRWLQTLAGAAIALAVFFLHLFGFVFFMLLIGSIEFTAACEGACTSASLRSALIARGAALCVVAALPIGLYLASPFAQAGGELGWLNPFVKLLSLLTPFLGYSLLMTAALVGVLVWTLWRSRTQRALIIAPFGLLCMALMAVLVFALPSMAKGGALIDTRVAALLGFMLFATVQPILPARRDAVRVTAALGVLLAVRVGLVATAWTNAQPDIADVRDVLSPVMPGSRVLMADAAPPAIVAFNLTQPIDRVISTGFTTAYRHDAAFALIDHDAFFADAFTVFGQQPIFVKGVYRVSGDGGINPPPSLIELAAYAHAARAGDAPSFYADWLQRFDYVLLLNADSVKSLADALPDHLALVGQKGFAALYRVVP